MAEDSSKIVVGKNKKANFFKRYRRFFIGVVAVIFLAGAVYAAISIFPLGNSRDNEISEVERKTELRQTANNIGNELSPETTQATLNKDTKLVAQLYDEKIAEVEGDPNAQAFLYLKKALDLRAAGAESQAVFDAVRRAESLDTEGLYVFDTYPLIGYTANELGQTQLAVDYLKKALVVFKSGDFQEAGLVEETETFIKELESKL